MTLAGARVPFSRRTRHCLLASLALLVGAGVVAGAGCLPGTVNLPGVGGDDYAVELTRWTRKEEVYRRFEAKIFLSATYHAPSFRSAYVRKRTAILGLPDRDRRALEEEQRRQGELFNEFFVAIYTGERRWNDLDRPGSIWRVSLVNDRGERAAPEQIVKVDSRNGEVVAFYPYLDNFSQAYLVRFPRTSLELNTPLLDPKVRSFKLQVSSSIAVAELVWDLDKM